MLYLIANAANRLDRRDRAIGWERVHLEREARKVLTECAVSLKDKGITEVWASDLDKDSAAIVANELHCGVRAEFQLRAFNIGRSHGAPISKVESILDELVKQWDKNPDIPIRGGDSLTSYRKRFIRKSSELVNDVRPFVLVGNLMSIRTVKSSDPYYWTKSDPYIQRGKIYVARESFATPDTIRETQNGRSPKKQGVASQESNKIQEAAVGVST